MHSRLQSKHEKYCRKTLIPTHEIAFFWKTVSSLNKTSKAHDWIIEHSILKFLIEMKFIGGESQLDMSITCLTLSQLTTLNISEEMAGLCYRR